MYIREQQMGPEKPTKKSIESKAGIACMILAFPVAAVLAGLVGGVWTIPALAVSWPLALVVGYKLIATPILRSYFAKHPGIK